ncbi:Muramidase-2 precursor [Arthrobacter agilis]|uniref:lytic transglycosylase domain-containing protein n=1 Tax=Arthrobacter agilis TaxID=37921 RepID=UPI000F6DF0C5|nr:lytic transglycosylase domain-containing protein [Arthrobacter agilis]VDR31793.1 Muramidase-2 precursor [Arthrobacter agilis]
MNAQRSNAPLPGVRSKPVGASPRALSVAVTTAALPAVMLSSVALAQPATAAPAPLAPATRHLVSPVAHVPARAVVPAALVAVQVPSQRIAVAAATIPADYTIKPGDTVSAIAKRFGLTTDAVLTLNRMNARTVIYPGQKLKLSGGSAPKARPAPAAAAPVTKTTASSYVVKPGDTLGAIASRNGVRLDSLLKANRLSMTSVIYPGQKLAISGKAPAAPAPAAPKPAPAPAPAPAGSYTIKPGDTLGAIASRNGVSLDSLLKANRLSMTSIIYPGQKLAISGKAPAAPAPAAPKPAAKPAPAPAPAPAGSYTIKPGDTLGAIASRNGVALSALLSANKMSMTTVIYPGRTLTIPGRGTTPAPAPAPAPTNLVPSSFLGYTYPDAVVADANANKALLNSLPAPSPAEMKKIVADTARSMGVDPSLALAFAFQESSFNQRSVSPANAIGTMRVIPSSGQWASDLVGRKLNLMDPYDNATAGIAIIRSLLRTSPSEEIAIASYYQGQYSVQSRGMYEDTKRYVAAIKGHQKNFR